MTHHRPLSCRDRGGNILRIHTARGFHHEKSPVLLDRGALRGLLVAAVWLGAPSARGEAVGEGAANVSCSFSHRLPDDPIIYPGRPGIAMSHDFFGHTTTTGNTTAEDLYTEHSSTCENAADNTSYWAPSLKLPDGRVVAPQLPRDLLPEPGVPGGHPPAGHGDSARAARCWPAITMARGQARRSTSSAGVEAGPARARRRTIAYRTQTATSG